MPKQIKNEFFSFHVVLVGEESVVASDLGLGQVVLDLDVVCEWKDASFAITLIAESAIAVEAIDAFKLKLIRHVLERLW